MTVTEAASKLKVSESSVRRMIRRGKLAATKVKTDHGQELQIREEDLAAVTPAVPAQNAAVAPAVTPPSPDLTPVLERLARIEGALAGQWQSGISEEVARLRQETADVAKAIKESKAREEAILAGLKELRKPWWKRLR